MPAFEALCQVELRVVVSLAMEAATRLLRKVIMSIEKWRVPKYPGNPSIKFDRYMTIHDRQTEGRGRSASFHLKRSEGIYSVQPQWQ